MRYYYKKDNAYFSFKNPIEDESYEVITEEEFNAHNIPLSVNNNEFEIEHLKHELSKSDYKALKFFEGYLTEEEYAPIKAYRQQLRDRINALEQEED